MLLAIPSIVSNITVPLLGLVDLAITGHLGSAAYIAAIAVGTMMFNVVYWLLGFLRMGTSGETSQAFGRQDHEAMARAFWRTLLAALIIGLTLLALQRPLFLLETTLMAPGAEVLPHVRTYYNICIWGLPAMLCINGTTGWFVGMQNTRAAMIVAIVQNMVNVAASLAFVFLCGMKVEGVALGTLVAQWTGLLCSMLLALSVFSKHSLDRKLPPLIELSRNVGNFFRTNADIFVRTICLVSVNFAITAFGSRQGQLLLSANTLLMTFFTLFSYAMDGFAYAGEALCGKYYGARDARGFHGTCRALLVIGLCMALLFTAVYGFGGTPFLRLLTDEETVIEAARQYLPWAVAIPIVSFAAFAYDGIFVGVSATRGMLVSTAIASAAFFSIVVLSFPALGNVALWLGLLVYLFLRGFVQLLWMPRIRL